MRRMGMTGPVATLRKGVVASAMMLGAVAATGRAAAAQTWAGMLSGGQAVPANRSTANGFASLTLAGNLLNVNVSWMNLVGGPVAAGHIHCCVMPGENAGIAVPFVGIANMITGTYTNSFDLMNSSVYTAAFLSANGGTAAGAEMALLNGLNAGEGYVNLHDAQYPGGEIRANVVTTPEPTTFALAALGLGGAGLLARRRRHG